VASIAPRLVSTAITSIALARRAPLRYHAVDMSIIVSGDRHKRCRAGSGLDPAQPRLAYLPYPRLSMALTVTDAMMSEPMKFWLLL
jgi:hypothetical protein